MKSILAGVFLLGASTLAFAGDAENIDACVKKAREMADVTLDPFAAVYEGKIFSMSTAKWDNAFCEVKLGDVYNLELNKRQVVYREFSGKASYDLNRELQEKTENAINLLNTRITLLQQRAEQVSVSLKQPNPNHSWLTQYIDEGIEKADGKYGGRLK